MIPTRGGNALVHLYRPQALTSPLPAVINFHGGGFVKGYRGRDIEFSQMIASRGTYLVLMWTTRLPRNIPTHAPLKKGKMWSLIFWHIWQTMTGTGTVRHSWGKLRRKPCHRNFLETEKIMAPQPSCVICCYPPCDLVTDPAVKAGGKKDDPMSERGRLYNSWYLPDGRNHEIYASPAGVPGRLGEAATFYGDHGGRRYIVPGSIGICRTSYRSRGHGYGKRCLGPNMLS